MASTPTTDYAREKRLIEQLEFRIASADTSDKLQIILQKFLPALLLKLSTNSTENRDLTVKVCQYISKRLQIETSIQLPIEALSQSCQHQSPFVKQFSLLFLKHGLTHLPQKESVNTLPSILRAVEAGDQVSANTSTPQINLIAIDTLLSTLTYWQPPATRENEDLGTSWQISHAQAEYLADILLLYVNGSVDDTQSSADLQPILVKYAKSRTAILPNLARFMFTPIFTDIQRFSIAITLSVDINAAAASTADTMFKQCSFDAEASTFVKAAFKLYNFATTKVRTRILSWLSRSKESTKNTEQISKIVQSQLTSRVTDLQSRKLQTAVFTYLIWALRMNATMSAVSDELIRSLKEFIDTQGWPTTDSLPASELESRGKAYESIGLLASAKATSQPNQSNFELVAWLFTSLRCDTSQGVRESIETSLGRMMLAGSTIHLNADEARYRELLLWQMLAKEGDEDPIFHEVSKNSSQYAASRFVNKIFGYSDVEARLIDIIALGSDRREVIEEGQRGLDPEWHNSNARLYEGSNNTVLTMPSFEGLMSRISQMITSGNERASILDAEKVLSGQSNFLLTLLCHEAWSGTSSYLEPCANWGSHIRSRLDNDYTARMILKDYLKQQNQDLSSTYLKRCLAGAAKGSLECAKIALVIASLTSDGLLRSIGKDALGSIEVALKHTSTRGVIARIFGIIVSIDTGSGTVAERELQKCSGFETAVGQELASVETSLMIATAITSRASARGHTGMNGLIEKIAGVCTKIIEKQNDKNLVNLAYNAFSQILLWLSPESSQVKIESQIFKKALSDAKKENEAAVLFIGQYLNLTWNDVNTSKDSTLLKDVYDLHEVRKPEFQFALGEALAAAALRFEATPVLNSFDIDVPVPDDRIHTDLFGQIMSDTLERCKSTKPALRKASGIWLLSMLEFSRSSSLLDPYLRDSQAAFSRLLNDRDQIVQETGSRGLGLVYEKGDKSVQEDLVRDLVSTFTGDYTKTSGTVSEDTQLFEAGALPTENGQSVTTYKDIVSLAQEMGDPSLVYRFMNLASNNAIWSSRAAFGRFGLSGVLANSDYLKENKKFYPKLFRYRFDPNPNVQRSMDDIWKALVKDSNAVLDANFDPIMQDLLKSVVSGKEWRAREASCAAIADLVQGRDIEKFEKYLDEMWIVAFKVLDDVKETVRLAAMKLCQTLTNMLVRNLEVGEGNTKRATAMLGHAMPFLLQQMDVGAGKEVQQYAIITLIDVVKKAPSRSLRSYAPIILETLINSLSSLEHESVNYIHLNADKYGITADKLDEMRVSSIGRSPITDTIDKCLETLKVTTDPDTNGRVSSDQDGEEQDPIEDAMRRLENSFKATIGLPSRVGLSKVMISLVVRHTAMFRSYADRFVKATRKNVLDRNATISQSFTLALAYLMRLASKKEVRQTIVYAQKLYFESEELNHRIVAGEIVQAIGKVSADVFNGYAPSFVPFTFIGRNDVEEDVASKFDATWKENVGGIRVLSMYLKEIVELTSTHMKSSLWPVKHACCFAAAELVSSDATIQYSRAEADTIWPLIEEAVNGKTWEGKERVIKAFPLYVKRAQAVWDTLTSKMRNILIREAKRTNVNYRPSAISALAEFCSIRSEVDISSEAVTILTSTAEELLDPDIMDIDKKFSEDVNSRESLIDRTLEAIIICAFAVLRKTSTVNTLDQIISISSKIHSRNQKSLEMLLCTGVEQYTDLIQGDDSNSKQQADSISGNAETQLFLNRLVSVLVQDETFRYASETEDLRLTRINMGIKVLKSNLASDDTQVFLRDVMQSWLGTERARPLRSLLEKALEQSEPTAEKA